MQVRRYHEGERAGAVGFLAVTAALILAGCGVPATEGSGDDGSASSLILGSGEDNVWERYWGPNCDRIYRDYVTGEETVYDVSGEDENRWRFRHLGNDVQTLSFIDICNGESPDGEWIDAGVVTGTTLAFDLRHECDYNPLFYCSLSGVGTISETARQVSFPAFSVFCRFTRDEDDDYSFESNCSTEFIRLE